MGKKDNNSHFDWFTIYSCCFCLSECLQLNNVQKSHHISIGCTWRVAELGSVLFPIGLWAEILTPVHNLGFIQNTSRLVTQKKWKASLISFSFFSLIWMILTDSRWNCTLLYSPHLRKREISFCCFGALSATTIRTLSMIRLLTWS